MNIKTKFNIGDKVKIITETKKYEHITCPICKGNYNALNPSYENDPEHQMRYLICNHCYCGVFKKLIKIEQTISDNIYEILEIKTNTVSETETITTYNVYNGTSNLNITEENLIKIEKEKNIK